MNAHDGVLFLVPARGGSVRVAGKNLRTVAGIPLVAHAIRLATRAARMVPGGPHAVVCSTDDEAIAKVARLWGAEVPFRRPAALASSEASSADVALHAIDMLGRAGRSFRALVLLQPTSPLTEPADVAAAVRSFDLSGGRPVTSVADSHPASWHGDLAAGVLTMVSHDRPGRRILTGAIYVVAPAELAETRRFLAPDGIVGLEVPPQRSVDVDVEFDLAVAEALAAARPVRPVVLGDVEIGPGRCLVVAEAGVNHNGEVALAHRLVDAAADAGADVVKFQTFDPDQLVSRGAPTAAYQRAGGAADDQHAMLSGLALPADAWPALRDHARERGLVFMSSPFDVGSAELLDRIGVPAFKIGSGELTNLPFLDRVARFGKPLLLSTGMAEMVEVAAAVDAVEAAGNPPIALFHCVSSYPAAAADANLRAIRTLRAAFGVPTGWSDHTPGTETDIAAVAVGAELVEKHLTLDRAMAGPDHATSLEPGAFAAMVRDIRSVSAALGTGLKTPVPAELDVARVARRSLHWTADLAAGSVIARDDLVALRPGTGLAPGRLETLVGRRVTRAVRAGSPVDATAIETPAPGPEEAELP